MHFVSVISIMTFHFTGLFVMFCLMLGFTFCFFGSHFCLAFGFLFFTLFCLAFLVGLQAFSSIVQSLAVGIFFQIFIYADDRLIHRLFSVRICSIYGACKTQQSQACYSDHSVKFMHDLSFA